MSSKRKLRRPFILLMLASIFAQDAAISKTNDTSLAETLNWMDDANDRCGGYFFDPVFTEADTQQTEAIHINSGQTLFSRNGTSVLEGNVTITRFGQQMTADKAFIFRDPLTHKPSLMELVGDVHLREPHTLVIAKKGRYFFQTRVKSLLNVAYRTELNSTVFATPDTHPDLNKNQKKTGLTASGRADNFSQSEPGIYDLYGTSFSTCPPKSRSWQVKASHIVLNKNTGRGYATNARLFVKSIPVFYWPYISFSIDHQRKTGFLWPTIGGGNKWGPYVLTPIYFNLAPNYDDTFTPGYLSKRGMQLNNQFNYLTNHSHGNLYLSVLPDDKDFVAFQKRAAAKFADSTDPATQAELTRLASTSANRKSLAFRDNTYFNENFSSKIDFSYVGDDYYLRDFGKNLNSVTDNQLLQEADLYYKSSHWNMLGRMQAYQTLHPVDETNVLNQYRRFPQFIANANYPNQKWGLDYFLNTEFTHFDIRNTPGTIADLPIGNRVNLQPGVSLPLHASGVYITPRMQMALTQYQLYQTADTGAPGTIKRVIPIFDVAAGVTFIRDVSIFQHGYHQTVEPQVYYTYIPYRNQSGIPIFDTTVSTLTYDQIFNYNRFSSIDRIGDANQIGVGVGTRFIDTDSGFEKAHAGLGALFYFQNRRVTFCNDNSCTDNPNNHSNEQRLSPLSGTFDYHMNEAWHTSVDAIWNPISKQISNTTFGIHYQPDTKRILNLGYSFVRNGETGSGIETNTTENNLKLTDISFVWPFKESMSVIGRWSQDFSEDHFQNILYGIQYDACCYAIRFVGGRAFTNLSADSTPQYNNEFYIQFAFKGLGNVGSGSPNGLLSTITGYHSDFEQVNT